MLEVKKGSVTHFLVGNQAFLLEIRVFREFKETIVTLLLPLKAPQHI